MDDDPLEARVAELEAQMEEQARINAELLQMIERLREQLRARGLGV